ncbi:hypothetical protein RJ43_12405 [Alteromonas macleodii]|nr:hypothetical protein RJ43_12405 [Alteromonas macleodii]
MENLESLWLFVCACLFPVTIFYFISFKQVTKILKQRHIEVYKSLGEVGFVKNNTITNSNKFVMYILQGKYSLLDDDELNKKAGICRLLLLTGLILFLVAFFLPIYIGNYK